MRNSNASMSLRWQARDMLSRAYPLLREQPPAPEESASREDEVLSFDLEDAPSSAGAPNAEDDALDFDVAVDVEYGEMQSRLDTRDIHEFPYVRANHRANTTAAAPRAPAPAGAAQAR